MLGELEDLDLRIKTEFVTGEIQRRIGDTADARSRMYRALQMARTIGNDAYTLRSLRLHGQLLIDGGEVDEGLRVLAFVLSRTDRRGDFTCEIINFNVWEERTSSLDPARVNGDRQWARDRDLATVVADVLTAGPSGTGGRLATRQHPAGSRRTAELSSASSQDDLLADLSSSTAGAPALREPGAPQGRGQRESHPTRSGSATPTMILLPSRLAFRHGVPAPARPVARW